MIKIKGIEILLSLEKNRLSIKAGGRVNQDNLRNVLDNLVKADSQLKENAGILLDLTEFNEIEEEEEMEAFLPKLLSKVKFVATIFRDSPHMKKNTRKNMPENIETKHFKTFDSAMEWLDLMQNK